MKDKEFKEMLKSIEQARAIRKGKLKPGRVFDFAPEKVKAVRKKLGLTQDEFARLIGISSATLKNWEQGRTVPDGPALALLRIAEANPAALSVLHAA